MKELGWPKFSMLCTWLYSGQLSPEEFTDRLVEAKRMTVVELRQSLEKLVYCEPIQVKISTDMPHEDRAKVIVAAMEEAATEHDKVVLEIIHGDFHAAPPKLGAAMPAGFTTAVEKTDGPDGIEPAAPDIDDNSINE